MLFVWRFHWAKIIPLLAVMFAAVASVADAEESGGLQVRLDEKVVYCIAELKGREEALLHALNDGIPVTTVWHLRVDRVRDYWLNQGVAEVSTARRVVPDLLSKSWLLEDQASGISRRVYMVSDAIRFLSTLEHFPVIDRSLLTTDAAYLMNSSVELHIGEVNDAWWANLLTFDDASMQQEFALP